MSKRISGFESSESESDENSDEDQLLEEIETLQNNLKKEEFQQEILKLLPLKKDTLLVQEKEGEEDPFFLVDQTGSFVQIDSIVWVKYLSDQSDTEYTEYLGKVTNIDQETNRITVLVFLDKDERTHHPMHIRSAELIQRTKPNEPTKESLDFEKRPYKWCQYQSMWFLGRTEPTSTKIRLLYNRKLSEWEFTTIIPAEILGKADTALYTHYFISQKKVFLEKLFPNDYVTVLPNINTNCVNKDDPTLVQSRDLFVKTNLFPEKVTHIDQIQQGEEYIVLFNDEVVAEAKIKSKRDHNFTVEWKNKTITKYENKDFEKYIKWGNVKKGAKRGRRKRIFFGNLVHPGEDTGESEGTSEEFIDSSSDSEDTGENEDTSKRKNIIEETMRGMDGPKKEKHNKWLKMEALRHVWFAHFSDPKKRLFAFVLDGEEENTSRILEKGDNQGRFAFIVDVPNNHRKTYKAIKKVRKEKNHKGKTYYTTTTEMLSALVDKNEPVQEDCITHRKTACSCKRKLLELPGKEGDDRRYSVVWLDYCGTFARYGQDIEYFFRGNLLANPAVFAYTCSRRLAFSRGNFFKWWSEKRI